LLGRRADPAGGPARTRGVADAPSSPARGPPHRRDRQRQEGPGRQGPLGAARKPRPGHPALRRPRNAPPQSPPRPGLRLAPTPLPLPWTPACAGVTFEATCAEVTHETAPARKTHGG